MILAWPLTHPHTCYQQQVAREAEEKEKAAKAAKRARKSRQLATTIITVAEPTSDQPTTPGDRRAEGGACLTVGGASLEVQRSEERASGSQLSLGVSSGLSESSDSLTDVRVCVCVCVCVCACVFAV